MSDEIDWERVCSRSFDWTDRLAVPGGWLYRNMLRDEVGENEPLRVTVVFVPRSAEE